MKWPDTTTLPYKGGDSLNQSFHLRSLIKKGGQEKSVIIMVGETAAKTENFI